MPDDVALYGSWYAGAYDEQGRGYLFCSTEMKELYRFTFVDGKATCEVLETGSLSHKFDESEQMPSAQADGLLVSPPNKSVTNRDGICSSSEVNTTVHSFQPEAFPTVYTSRGRRPRHPAPCAVFSQNKAPPCTQTGRKCTRRGNLFADKCAGRGGCGRARSYGHKEHMPD